MHGRPNSFTRESTVLVNNVQAIQENPYMQYLLGLSKFTEKARVRTRVVRFDPQAPWPGLLQHADLDTERSGRKQTEERIVNGNTIRPLGLRGRTLLGPRCLCRK